MTSFLRESKFRHTFVQLDKREKYYESAMLKAANVEGNSITANSKYISYIDASYNAIGILPVDKPGRINEISMIRAKNVNDIVFHKFYRDKLLACTSDGNVNMYDMTNGISNDAVSSIKISNCSDTLVAPLKKIINNPIAENIIAVSGNKDLSIVDLNTASQARKTPNDLFGSDISCISFSENGSLIAASSKDKTLKIIDMRCQQDKFCNVSVQCHAGTKPSNNLWLNNEFIFTSGHNSSIDREIFLWDIKQMSQPVFKERIDSSIGILSPFYDPDTQLLILAGKGDTMIRLYEFDSNSVKLFGISSVSVGDPFRSSVLMPKQACDLNNNEILRVLKLSDTSIQPISFTVPRKDKRVFHSDLYPPSLHETPPSIDAESWLAGLNGEPQKTLISLDLKSNIPDNSALITDTIDIKVAHDINDTSGKRNSLERFIGFGSTLKFRHMYGTEVPKSQSYFNIRPSTAADSALISCSDTYWAVPYEGTGGGPVYVSSFSDVGKVEPSCPLINGHKAPVVDISFSPFHSNIMATASADCSVKLWSIPPKIKSSQGDSDAIMAFSTHMNTVKACCFSPTIDGLLCSSSADMTVRLYDINAGKELSCTDLRSISGAQSGLNSLSFNYDGTTVMTCCKDKCLNIIDLRISEVIGSIYSPENGNILGRNLRGIWCNKNHSQSIIFTVFSNHLGQRMIQLYDPRKLISPVISSVIDNGTGQLFPLYDENNIVFVAGKGDTIIKFYELNFLEDSIASCDKANEFQTSRDPIAGVCLLPKRVIDVRNVEIASMLKLTNDAVIPISYKVPRAEHLKQYFQDDLYPSTIKSMTPNYRVSDWMQICGHNADIKLEPSLEQLKPQDMTNLSEKPISTNVSAKSNRNSQDFKKELDKARAENELKEATFNKLSELALQRAQYHPNPSGGNNGHGFKVDAAPVIDTGSDSDADWDE